ncbi:MAG: CoA transferase [Deltaproteobacteria bacterium]|nr:CoA transferase [Deltaproteobacteria bacterium]
MDSLLTGYRALDLTDEKGFMCGKILGAMGVDVIKIEKPGGDSSRNIFPYVNDVQDPEQSLYWLAFNTDKRGITLNLKNKDGKDLFTRLVQRADFVIESFQPGYMEDLGLGYGALSGINPRIIVTSITPFGQSGPYAHFKASNLVTYAMSGVMMTNGDLDRAPVKEAVDVTYYEAGAHAALGTIIAHYHRERTGEGQQVDVSIQESTANRDSINLYVWEFDKRFLQRTGNKSLVGANVPSQWIWPCKDGYIFWAFRGGPVPMGTPGNQALSKWLDEEGAENPFKTVNCSKGLDMASLPRETLDIFESMLGRFFLMHTRQEITERAFQTGMQAWGVSDPAEVMKNPQLDARAFWKKVENSEPNQEILYPGYFFLCSETENFIKRQAPHIGEHNEEIYIGELGLSKDKINVLKKRGII